MTNLTCAMMNLKTVINNSKSNYNQLIKNKRNITL